MSRREELKLKSGRAAVQQNVPEWNGVVEIRSIGGALRWKFGQLAAKKDEGDFDYFDLLPLIVIDSIYDPETGEPLWQAEDAEWLIREHAPILERLGPIIFRISGLTEVSKKEAVKEIAGPLEKGPSNGSSGSSAGISESLPLTPSLPELIPTN